MFRVFRSYFRFGNHRHSVDRLGELNALISGLALYPQLWKTIRTESTEDLSLAAFFVIFVNSVVWFLYALHRKLPPLLLSSTLNLLASGSILAVMASTRVSF